MTGRDPTKPGDTPADMEKAAFLSECVDDMSETWTDMIAEILSFLPFGFSLHEPVFKRRLGASRDPKRNSQHNDGRIGWQKIPGRAQETIDRWLFNEDTGLNAAIVDVRDEFEVPEKPDLPVPTPEQVKANKEKWGFDG